MDVRRLRTGEALAGAAGFLLIVVLFFTWYDVSPCTPPANCSPNAWQAFGFIDVVLLVAGLSGVGLALLTAAQRTVAVPVAMTVVTAGMGLLALLLVLYRIINQPGPNEIVTVGAGAYLGLLCCAGVCLGGFMAMRDDGPGLGERAAPEVPTRPAPPPGRGR